MGGNTGNIRGQRNQSSCNGYKTLGSILASDAGSGAGSIRRLYGYYAKQGQSKNFFNEIFNISNSQSQFRSQLFFK